MALFLITWLAWGSSVQLAIIWWPSASVKAYMPPMAEPESKSKRMPKVSIKIGRSCKLTILLFVSIEQQCLTISLNMPGPSVYETRMSRRFSLSTSVIKFPITKVASVTLSFIFAFSARKFSLSVVMSSQKVDNREMSRFSFPNLLTANMFARVQQLLWMISQTWWQLCSLTGSLLCSLVAYFTVNSA